MAGAPLKLPLHYFIVSRRPPSADGQPLINIVQCYFSPHYLPKDEQLSSQFNVHVYDTTILAPRGFDMALP